MESETAPTWKPSPIAPAGRTWHEVRHQILQPNLRWSYKSAKAGECTFGLATFWPESQCQNFSNLKDLKIIKDFKMSPMSPWHSACIGPPVLLEPEFRPRTEAWTDPPVKSPRHCDNMDTTSILSTLSRPQYQSCCAAHRFDPPEHLGPSPSYHLNSSEDVSMCTAMWCVCARGENLRAKAWWHCQGIHCLELQKHQP